MAGPGGKGGPGKMGKAGGKGGATGEAWVCDNCGNQNFVGRVYCNMRQCGNPGPWICPACGNKNFAGRRICNSKKCNQPIPPPPAGAGPLAFSNGAGTDPGVGPASEGASTAAQAIAMLQSSGLANIPGVAAGIQQIVESGAMGPAAQGLSMSLGPPTAAASKQQGEVREGSWVCIECGNINFPNRDVCNGRTCQKPRIEVDGGPPDPGATPKTRLKPGSWVCGACNNINYPDRDMCGMRRCGLPRAQVDAGPPAGL